MIKMDKINNDDEGDGVDMNLPIYTTSTLTQQHKIYIDEPIGFPSKYRNALFALDNAGQKDVVAFHLNTPGGNVDTTIQLYNGIINTEAHTVAVCHGTVASCGTIIALACAETIVLPHTTWMIHPISWGLKGDTKTIRDAVDFNTEQIIKLCEEVYFGFLTEKEINDMIENSKELWMTAEEVSERLEMRNDIIAEALVALENDKNGAVTKAEKPKKRVAKKK